MLYEKERPLFLNSINKLLTLLISRPRLGMHNLSARRKAFLTYLFVDNQNEHVHFDTFRCLLTSLFTFKSDKHKHLEFEVILGELWTQCSPNI